MCQDNLVLMLNFQLSVFNAQPVFLTWPLMIKTFYLNRIVYYIAGLASWCLYWLFCTFPGFTGLVSYPVITGDGDLVDVLLLFSRKKGMSASRKWATASALVIPIKWLFVYKISTGIKWKWVWSMNYLFSSRNETGWGNCLFPAEKKLNWYTISFLPRGVCFHDINVYVHAPLQLVKRRYIFPKSRWWKCILLIYRCGSIICWR